MNPTSANDPARAVGDRASSAMLRIERGGLSWTLSAAAVPLLEKILNSPAEVVKRLPPRSVTRHQIDGRTFYIKKYFHSASMFAPLKYFFKKPASRDEWDLAPKLERLGIPIVPHLAHGECWNWRGLRESVLITEGPKGFAPLTRASISDSIQPALGKFLRHLHDCSIFHNDLHISNLLYSAETNEFCLVDLDNMEIFPSLTEEQRILNLATLNRKLPLSAQFYENYDDTFLRHAKRIARRTNQKLRASIPKKLTASFQDQQAFALHKAGGLTWHVRAKKRSEKLESILLEPDGFLARRARLLKNGTSSTVGCADGFVLKRSNLKKPQNLFFDLFRPSRARRAFRLARHLELLRIATPFPIAMAERRRLGLVVRSYFVMEEIAGAVSFSKWRGDRGPAIKRVAQLIAKLHSEGFTHRDLREANILFPPDGQPCLIDLDGLRYVKKTSPRRAAADLARLMQGIKGEMREIPAKHRLRFLKEYCAKRDMADWRWWWCEIGKNLPATKPLK